MKRKNTLLKKIVILFLSLVFPLLIVWLGTIQFSNQTLKRQILSSIDSNNATFIAHLNNSLYTIYASALPLRVSPTCSGSPMRIPVLPPMRKLHRYGSYGSSFPLSPCLCPFAPQPIFSLVILESCTIPKATMKGASPLSHRKPLKL